MAKGFPYRKAENPFWFWFMIVLYSVLSVGVWIFIIAMSRLAMHGP